MKKILIICGSTATGKTGLALKLAKKFNGEIVSADSRQVYQGMDIATGKDLPTKARFKIEKSGLEGKNLKIGYYQVNGIRLWLYDIVKPDYFFNVSDWVKCAQWVIEDIYRRGKLPILVGGTGFYLKAIVEDIPTKNIPPNLFLREKLELKSRKVLFNELAELDSSRAGQMNTSDKQNRRRLIRAIEIARWRIEHRLEKTLKPIKFDSLIIGLKAPLKFLYQKIDQRVEKQFKNGAEREIERLVNQGFSWDLPSMSALGYREWQSKLEGQASLMEVLIRCQFDEHAYARRQMTWFKKQKEVYWFDISRKGWENKVEKQLSVWYTGKNA
jgi:tRNA dimethylallyltransferase